MPCTFRFLRHWSSRPFVLFLLCSLLKFALCIEWTSSFLPTDKQLKIRSYCAYEKQLNNLKTALLKMCVKLTWPFPLDLSMYRSKFLWFLGIKGNRQQTVKTITKYVFIEYHCFVSGKFFGRWGSCWLCLLTKHQQRYRIPSCICPGKVRYYLITTSLIYVRV